MLIWYCVGLINVLAITINVNDLYDFKTALLVWNISLFILTIVMLTKSTN